MAAEGKSWNCNAERRDETGIPCFGSWEMKIVRRKPLIVSRYFLQAFASLFLCAVIGCGLRAPEITFSRFTTGHGSIEVRYIEILGAAAFASHTVRFYFVVDGCEQLLAETQFANDGKNPGSHNIDFFESSKSGVTSQHQ
jgi:hypothetical protein